MFDGHLSAVRARVCVCECRFAKPTRCSATDNKTSDQQTKDTKLESIYATLDSSGRSQHTHTHSPNTHHRTPVRQRQRQRQRRALTAIHAVTRTHSPTTTAAASVQHAPCIYAAMLHVRATARVVRNGRCVWLTRSASKQQIIVYCAFKYRERGLYARILAHRRRTIRANKTLFCFITR